MALAVPLSRFTPRVGGGSAFFVRRLHTMSNILTKRWSWLVIVLAVLWVSAEVRYRLLHHRLATLWVTTVAFNVIDDSSGAHLPCSIGDMPGLAASDDYLPSIVVGGSTAEKPSVIVASDKR